MYIYEHSDWTDFTWNPEQVTPLLSDARFAQGKLLGRIDHLGFSIDSQLEVDAVSDEVVASSRIEGVELDTEKVRSSVTRQLGLDSYDPAIDTRSVDGAVSVMVDATQGFAEPMTLERLQAWHAALFPAGYSGLRRIAVAQLRTGPMRVVSGPIGRERVHYEAPAADDVQPMITEFLAWLNKDDPDALLKAGIAHLWFLSIHPFDDGNGRIARALTEMLLARSDGSPRRFYSMASYILAHREGYYAALERAQKGTNDITQWLCWFLRALSAAIASSEEAVSAVEQRERWWESVGNVSLNDRQRHVLHLLLGDFQGKLTTGKWAKLCKVSTDTALRDINDLIEKGILEKDGHASGRSTSYLLRSTRGKQVSPA